MIIRRKCDGFFQAAAACILRNTYHGESQRRKLLVSETILEKQIEAQAMNINKEGVMPILKKLKEALDEEKISYEVYNHALAYTAQEIAARQHFSGKEMAKVVMLDVDGALVMGVVPGSRKISLDLVRANLGAKKARLATEDEFIARFPDCEIGAMPPFGNLFGLKVYVDPGLEEDENIYFNAGNHTQTVRLKYADFASLAKPQVARLVEERKKRAA
jgi:Ala-tRNA(Pro) deacylase